MKDQIFNEISAIDCYKSRQEAASGMERMSRLIQKLSEVGYSRQLRVTRDFSMRRLSYEYTIKNWAVDKTVDADREFQRFLLLAASKSPYVEDTLEEAQKHFLIEYKFEDVEVFGLGLASMWNTCTISLDGDPKFSRDRVKINVYKADEVVEEEKLVDVINLASLDHVDANQESLRGSLLSEISNGEILLQKVPFFFPNLSFGKAAQKQLRVMKGSEQYFLEVIRHFDVLSTTMKNLSDGAFDPQGISWSPESQATLNQYGKCREFEGLDGVVRQFSLHSKLMAANMRIHFFPISNEKIVHIGYVGDHLPTVRFKH